MGFDETKVRCYNCQEYGHFVKECVKSKVEFDSQKKPNTFQNNRTQSHGSSGSGNSNHASTSSALVAQNDENYDWGIHLEDLVGAISQAFVAEIHSENPEDSTDDHSSSDGESLQSVDEEHVKVQTVDSDIASASVVSEDDIVLTKRSSDDDESEDIPIAKVFMADMSDSSKVKDFTCTIYCSNCICVKDKMQKVMDDNTNLICDMKSMHVVNQKFKDNDKLCMDRIESLKRDLNSLGLKYKQQAYHLDMAYAEIEKRNEIVAQKNKEISDKESEVIKLHRKLDSFGNSYMVLDYFNDNADPTKQVAGVGFVPPPFNGNYVIKPEVILEEELDPKTVLNVNHVTGIPKEVNIDEPKVVKQVTRDRCILTEADEVIQPKLSKVLQTSGFVATGHQKKLSSKPTSDVVKKVLLRQSVPTQSFAKSSGFKQNHKHFSKPVVGHIGVRNVVAFQKHSEIPRVGITKDSQPQGQPRRTINNMWYVDSGCSRHMTGNIRLLEDVIKIDGGYVTFAGNKGGYITGQCTLKNDKVNFEKVNYVEQLEHNLLSVSQVCDKKFSFHFNDTEYDFSRFSWVKFLASKAENHRDGAILNPGFRELVQTENSKLPVTFWDEAVNRVLTVKRHKKTCYELLNNRKPNLEYLLHFGNPCTLLKVKDVPTKFSAKAIERIFMGYVANSTIKRVYNKETCQSFHLPSDISPEEAAVLYESCQDTYNGGFIRTVVQHSSVPSTSTPDPNVASCSGPQDSDSEEDDVVFQDSSIDSLFVDEPSTSTQAHWEIPINLELEISVNQDLSSQSEMTQVDVLSVPEVASIKELKDHLVTNIIGNLRDGVHTGRTKECRNGFCDNNWIEAMQEELAQFDKLKVWNLLDPPKGVYPIGTKWVFKCKKDDRGVVVRNKARLVIPGFNEKEGIDYTEVYAPVARLEAIRLFLAFASYKGFKVFQLDVKSALLYGKFKEEVYVCQTPVFEDPVHPSRVFKLDKALYGLHQAPHAWYETLSKHLMDNGFVRGQID
ncbi:hypothetical protein L1987_30488 [Smallanthus sonchifolius]|uniref:Uncharacterized protein n=1 Tax=Smallanthus sonchifolius TaxID=185202 RepID=A0ACB9I2Q9_9ASTR|nr:hypothetical protein L1987_30488 [Smallanthus sonchifolius]